MWLSLLLQKALLQHLVKQEPKGHGGVQTSLQPQPHQLQAMPTCLLLVSRVSTVTDLLVHCCHPGQATLLFWLQPSRLQKSVVHTHSSGILAMGHTMTALLLNSQLHRHSLLLSSQLPRLMYKPGMAESSSTAHMFMLEGS